MEAEVTQQSLHEDLRQLCVRLAVPVAAATPPVTAGSSQAVPKTQQRRHVTVVLETRQDDVKLHALEGGD